MARQTRHNYLSANHDSSYGHISDEKCMGNFCSDSASPCSPNIKMLNVYFSNCRSVCNKVSELELLLHSLEYDILIFCETWLPPHSRVPYFCPTQITHFIELTV